MTRLPRQSEPPSGGIFTGPQSITLTCSDSVACNAIAFTTDGSDPNFAGQTSIIVPGNKASRAITNTTTVATSPATQRVMSAVLGSRCIPSMPARSTYSIGGTISGLSGTVVPQNNAGNNLSVSANGSFAFSTTLTTGTNYAVTVLTQPTGQTCNVTSGSGTVASANVTNVSVSCTNNTYTIGGTISGLSGHGRAAKQRGQQPEPHNQRLIHFFNRHRAQRHLQRHRTDPARRIDLHRLERLGHGERGECDGCGRSCASVTCVLNTSTLDNCKLQ
ncbi:MAG: chitobiase/beta-hexosaminidase C-terminal domain-containing protein [Turneriella sp.]